MSTAKLTGRRTGVRVSAEIGNGTRTSNYAPILRPTRPAIGQNFLNESLARCAKPFLPGVFTNKGDSFGLGTKLRRGFVQTSKVFQPLPPLPGRPTSKRTARTIDPPKLRVG